MTYSKLEPIDDFILKVLYCQIMHRNVDHFAVLPAMVLMISCHVTNCPQTSQFKTTDGHYLTFLWVKSPDAALSRNCGVLGRGQRQP